MTPSDDRTTAPSDDSATAPSDDSVTAPSDDSATAPSDDSATTVTCDLALTWQDGREETVPASGEETVLEAAESAGVSLPFGCRTGACGTCVGRLLDGEVRYRRPPRALERRHVESGHVLCCIARPRTDCRVEVGADVLAALVSNPWK